MQGVNSSPLSSFTTVEGNTHTVQPELFQTMSLLWKNKFTNYFEEWTKDQNEIAELQAKIESGKTEYQQLKANEEFFTVNSIEIDERCTKLEAGMQVLEQGLADEKKMYDSRYDLLGQNAAGAEEQLKSIAKNILNELIETVNEQTSDLSKELELYQKTIQSNDTIIEEQQKLIAELEKNSAWINGLQGPSLEESEAAKKEIQEKYREDKKHYLELLSQTESEITKITEQLLEQIGSLSFESS